MLWFIAVDLINNEYSYEDLNTSYVMVHPTLPFPIDLPGSDLNTSYVMVHLRYASGGLLDFIFKYILCYGSSSWKKKVYLLS